MLVRTHQCFVSAFTVVTLQFKLTETRNMSTFQTHKTINNLVLLIIKVSQSFSSPLNLYNSCFGNVKWREDFEPFSNSLDGHWWHPAGKRNIFQEFLFGILHFLMSSISVSDNIKSGVVRL